MGSYITEAQLRAELAAQELASAREEWERIGREAAAESLATDCWLMCLDMQAALEARRKGADDGR